MTRTSPITLRWEFKWFFRRGPPACKNAVYTWLQCTRIFIQTSCRTSNQPTGRRWGSNLPLQTLILAGESSSAPWRYCSPLWLFCCNLLSNSVMWWVVLLFFFIFYFYFCPFFPGAAHWLWKRCICGVCGPADPCDPVLQTGLHNPAVKGDNNPTVLFLKKEINQWVGLWIFVHSDLIQEVSFIRWMKTWRSRRRETLSRKACFTSARTSLKVLKKTVYLWICACCQGLRLKQLIYLFCRLQPGARWHRVCSKRLGVWWCQWGVHTDEHWHNHQWKGELFSCTWRVSYAGSNDSIGKWCWTTVSVILFQFTFFKSRSLLSFYF